MLWLFSTGTPSLAKPHTIAKVIDELTSTVGVVEGAEVCLEANPTSAETEKLKYVYRQYTITFYVFPSLRTKMVFIQLGLHDIHGIALYAACLLSDLDVHKNFHREFKLIGVNRLSLGVQSLRDSDLRLMNRDHNVAEAKRYNPVNINLSIIILSIYLLP